MKESMDFFLVEKNHSISPRKKNDIFCYPVGWRASSPSNLKTKKTPQPSYFHPPSQPINLGHVGLAAS